MRVVLFFLLIPIYYFSSAAALPVVSKGELDLTTWNTQQLPAISLAGEWRFYWQALLTFNQLDSEPYALAQLTIPWNEQKIDGKALPKNGYATYALKIKLPPTTQEVAFVVPAVFNSYAFWVNDKLICSSGQPGRNEAETTPKWKPQTVRVPVNSPNMVVLFQIANFQNTRGGCAEVMRIGDAAYLTRLSTIYYTTGKALVVFCALLFVAGIAVYYLTEAKGYLHLAFLGFAYMLRFLFSDLYLASDFEINLPWLVAAKIEYATVPLIVFAAATFVSGIYPKEFKRAARIFFQASSFFALLGIILVPSAALTPMLLLLQVLGLSLAAYSAISIFRAIVINRTGAWVTALSMGVLIAVASYNVYTFIMVIDLNRTFIHIGYACALGLSAFSLMYRTPVRLKQEDSEMLRYEDLYGK
ncbi:MAG: hypothetical protein KF856_01785 [Cyclobacteriaceae bacterium]|nr:hypothetical protein [Cyclobacteriaceae bacterium]